MAEAATSLNEALRSVLQQETLVLLTTLDADQGSPQVNAISWVYAKDESTIRFAVDARSRIVANLKAKPQVALSFFAEGAVNAVNGEAAIVTEELQEVPFKLACIDVRIEQVRDVMFYGARISAAPEYEKTYDKRAADKLDGQVFDSMKKA